MLILVAIDGGGSNRRNLMVDIMERLSLVRDYVMVNFRSEIIHVKFPDTPDIKILFRPTSAEKVKGYHPDYYFTNDYDVDEYFRSYGVPELKNRTEIVAKILESLTDWLTTSINGGKKNDYI